MRRQRKRTVISYGRVRETDAEGVVTRTIGARVVYAEEGVEGDQFVYRYNKDCYSPEGDRYDRPTSSPQTI
jgi:hypothetical protein